MRDADRPGSLRVVVVGPVPPLRGGIAQHTGQLVAAFREAGHQVTVVSWARQYPGLLYPSEQVDVRSVVVDDVRFTLRWWWPFGWWRVGREARQHDLLVVPWVHPVQALALRIVTAAAGRTPTVGVVHNALPHERLAVDRFAVRLFLRGIDGAVTHVRHVASDVQELAPSLAVATAPHPPNLQVEAQPAPARPPLRLLFLGYVRPYKGLDLLLDAVGLLAGDPPVSVTVAGEFWEPDEAAWRRRVADLGLSSQVDLQPGYVRDEDVGPLIASHHVVVAPYRAATQSGILPLAHAAGRPVIVTPVGGLPEQVRDGVDGIVSSDVSGEALADAIVLADQELARLEAGASRSIPTWADVTAAVLGVVDVPLAGGPR